jgi:transcriptional antiterminator RfaH
MMQPRWVVLRTRVRREMAVAQEVATRGVECYCPSLPQGSRRGQRQALFPGYVFARLEPHAEHLVRVRSAPGVVYVLPRDAPPVFLPDQLIDEFRARAAQPRAELARGDRVKIESGPFRWAEAVFDRRLNGAGRVRVLLHLVHRFVALDLDEQQLRRVPSVATLARHRTRPSADDAGVPNTPHRPST